MIGRFTPIHDPDDPRIAVYRNQKDAWLRAGHHPQGPGQDHPDAATGIPGGRFMAEGALVVEHLLRSDYAMESVLVSEHRVEALAGLLERVHEGVPIFCCSRRVMEGILGFDMHRGLLACGLRGEPRKLAELTRDCRALIVLEDLTNHDNVGSVFRSAAVLGGAGVGVLLSPRCCDPLYRKSLRVSMGHALTVPFATVTDWPGGLAAVRDAGFTLLALDPRDGAEPIDRVDGIDRPALVFGAEGPGLSDKVRSLIGHSVMIPQARGVDSLNIAVAAAVAIHRLIPPAG
ncbi:MAG: RNA methyltransferase [Planctomycetota bacterium]|nr:MAG: RNA methyltransferase [Planctomycetota bacterium]